MANRKISEDALLAAADIDGAADYTPIVDASVADAGQRNKRSLWNTIADWVVKYAASFVQSGIGAIAEPVQTAVRRIVWAEQYGFATSGTTAANGAALQAAIDAVYTAGYGEVHIGVGTFSFNGVTRKAGVSIIGQGLKSTILSYTGSGIAIDSQDIFDTVDAGEMKGFKLTTTTSSPSVGPGTIGVAFRNTIIASLEGVEIRGFSTVGVDMISTAGKSCIDITIGKDCHIHENAKGVRHSGVNTGANAIKFIGARVRANIEWNIYSELDNRAWSIIGCVLEAGGTGGTGGSVFLRQAVGLIVHGNYFEQTAVLPAIEFSDTQDSFGISIMGNVIDGPGTGTAIKLGTSAFVRGVHISGNAFLSWTTGIDPNAVIGGYIGPNYYTSVTTEVAAPGSNCTGLTIHDPDGSIKTHFGSISGARKYHAVTAGAAQTPNAGTANSFVLDVGDGGAFTINAPTNPADGQDINFIVWNQSGGAMGAITWNAIFKLAGAFTNPASTKRRTISFSYDSDNTAWVELGRAAADI